MTNRQNFSIAAKGAIPSSGIMSSDERRALVQLQAITKSMRECPAEEVTVMVTEHLSALAALDEYMVSVGQRASVIYEEARAEVVSCLSAV